jgi:hypothetical protein
MANFAAQYRPEYCRSAMVAHIGGSMVVAMMAEEQWAKGSSAAPAAGLPSLYRGGSIY